ncbi:biopolymer transporter ExbD [candidate division KSB1 bacterium]|nr:biopolymer transporter ExbD [candidate division KSB1 bacterium]
MNLKQTINRQLRGHARDAEVNLTAVMNVFLILIPFLLLTASFVRIAILELTLPSLDRAGQPTTVQKAESTVLNILLIRETELQLNSPGLKFDKIARLTDDYNWSELTAQLQRVKSKFPDSEDIIISPENTIRYETIIVIMDECREAGFPNISISG